MPAAPPDGVVHASSRGVGVPTGDCDGRVVSAVGAGWYLDLGGELVAVLDPGAQPGPIHLVTDRPTVRPGVGSSVRQVRGLMHTEAGSIDLRGGVTFRPPPIGDAPAAVRRRACSTLGDLKPDPDSVFPSEGLPDPDVVGDLLEHSDLAGALRSLAGRGGGLTPAGDDVSAGILLGTRLRNGTSGGDVGRDLVGLLAEHPSGEPSLTFLRWASRGQTIRAVHRLIEAASVGRDLSASYEQVRGIGATSGSALLAGLIIAARQGARPGATPVTDL